MEEIDAETLVAFAEANGLSIMSHRDPRKWAEALNKNNGLCPCGKECPCDDCTCKFYEKGGETEIVIKNEEIAHAIEAMETVKEMLSNMSEDQDEAAKTAMDAAKIIEEDAKKHTCEQCGRYVKGLQRKLSWLGEECAKDPMSCVLERDATVTRIETMQGVFVEVDKSINESEDREQKESQETKEILDSQWTDPFKDAVFSEFHGCVGKTFNEDLADVPMGDRMCVASKICSKAKPTKEDAMKACVEANKK